MEKFDLGKAQCAVREAMVETVAQYGIEFVRTLSCFPSSERVALKKAA